MVDTFNHLNKKRISEYMTEIKFFREINLFSANESAKNVTNTDIEQKIDKNILN